MAVFKIVGKIVKILEGGSEKEYITKTYVRANHADHAEIMAINLGFLDIQVSYFGNNCTSLGNESDYAADNGHGVMPGW